ncbi:hypothetical protein FACS189431_4630 [Alphaproteobacteria bacterium]|nr:hypothetical protein FACS189431_4630 [Alphaproteobacteria bacterium]
MLIVSLFSWWYSTGFIEQLASIKALFVKVNDQFSIPLLAKTLFKPFREIDNYRVDGALEDKFQAWFGRLTSRLIGALIRIVVMVVGLVVLILLAIISCLRIVIWLAMPALPFVGLALLPWITTILSLITPFITGGAVL